LKQSKATLEQERGSLVWFLQSAACSLDECTFRNKDHKMKSLIAIAVIAAMTLPSAALAATSTEFSSAKSAYAAKKAECKERAKSKHFGIHWIKRNRWINDCIAGAH
jgi:hypothetical protein